MSTLNWIFLILATIGWHVGMYGMFKKASITPWKALIPFYNMWCIIEKMGIKKVWFYLQFIPIVGQVVTIWLTIKFVEGFGRFSVTAHALTVLVPYIYFNYLGYNKTVRFVGKTVVANYRKTVAREWFDAAIFAIVAATIIRTFIFEAYTIPTPSMEKTLLVNDFLFVSKMSYGPRLPMTPLSIPFMHNTIPGTHLKSYSTLIELPYKRWFPQDVTRGDVTVFNFPVNDTFIDMDEFGSRVTYYAAVRMLGREQVWDKYGYRIKTRPVDKRENFIKRCVGVGGDEVKVVNGKVFINGAPQNFLPDAEKYMLLTTPPGTFVDDLFIENLGINLNDPSDFGQLSSNQYLVNVTQDEKNSLKPLPEGYTLTNYISTYKPQEAEQLFPYYDTLHQWSTDNFGPVTIPKKGSTIALTPDNIIKYGRCISTYEGNKLEQKNGTYYINGSPATNYTFKYAYYWMMGDNRDNSLDSRFWGFVPEDHIVGKASFVFFSWGSKGPRWNRVFKTIK